MEQQKNPPSQTWQKALLPINSTIQQAVQNLDASALQIALVVDRYGMLAGTITDGDIRRGLLRGLDLSSSIDGIIHRSPFVVPPDWSSELVLQLMETNNIRQMPVVDADHRIVGLHVWNTLKIPSKRPNLMVIMAGGKGMRLRPQTEHCPKPMLPVNGKPLLEHLIDRAKAEGFSNFVIAIHYLGYMIEEYFGNGERWKVDIGYIREENPLGTAGALGLLCPRPDTPILVTNGDLMTDFRYGELLDFHCRHRASATMAVRLYEWQNPFGVVHTDGVDITGFEEKPVIRNHINAGMYVLEPKVLDLIGENECCYMPTLFTRLQERFERTIVFPMHEPWLDVGRSNDLERARNGKL